MTSISRASSASVTAMIPHTGAAPLLHGGDVAAARRLFPAAPEPFIDLSTGINPHSYPLPQLPSELFARLPEPAALDGLAAAAAQAYGAPSSDHVVPAPGTQILLPLVAALVPPGRAAVLGPTYSEHARVAALVGHRIRDATEMDGLAGADLAVVVNPNNPDGRLVARAELIARAAELRFPRRYPRGRRGIHGCRSRRESQRRRRPRLYRRAAVVREVFRPRWSTARLRARRSGHSRAAQGIARAVGGFRRRNCSWRGRVDRSLVEGGRARAARPRGATARRAAGRAGTRHRRGHANVPPRANAGCKRAVSPFGPRWHSGAPFRRAARLAAIRASPRRAGLGPPACRARGICVAGRFCHCPIKRPQSLSSPLPRRSARPRDGIPSPTSLRSA